MQGSHNEREGFSLIGNARTFMGAGVGFRLAAAGICLVALWLCVGWAVSA